MNAFEKNRCECTECVGAGCTCGCQGKATERTDASRCKCGCQEGKRCGCAKSA